MKSPPESRTPPAWWQRPLDGYTLTFASLISGAMLWEARYPSFVFSVVMLWAGTAAVIGIRLVIAGIGTLLTGRPVVATGWRGVMALVTIVSVVLVSRLPLHAGFALARTGLDRALQEDQQPGDSFQLSRYQYGVYGIRGQTARRRCHHEDRIYFELATDKESAFVYSPSGIDDLCYNSGSKGHLSGHWYWMAED